MYSGAGPLNRTPPPSTTSASPAKCATGSAIRRASNTRWISPATMMSGSLSIASWRWTWGAFIPRSRDESCSTRPVAGLSPCPDRGRCLQDRGRSFDLRGRAEQGRSRHGEQRGLRDRRVPGRTSVEWFDVQTNPERLQRSAECLRGPRAATGSRWPTRNATTGQRTAIPSTAPARPVQVGNLTAAITSLAARRVRQRQGKRHSVRPRWLHRRLYQAPLLWRWHC